MTALRNESTITKREKADGRSQIRCQGFREQPTCTSASIRKDGRDWSVSCARAVVKASEAK